LCRRYNRGRKIVSVGAVSSLLKSACLWERAVGSQQDGPHEIYAMQSIELIRQFLHERVGTSPDRVVNDALLADFGVDSLLLAELMFEAEDRLGISIGADATIPKTVGDLVRQIDALLVTKIEKAALS